MEEHGQITFLVFSLFSRSFDSTEMTKDNGSCDFLIVSPGKGSLQNKVNLSGNWKKKEEWHCLIPDYFSAHFHAMQFKTLKKKFFFFFFPTVFALVTTTLACWLPVLSFLVGSELLPSCGAGGRSLGSWRDGAGWLRWSHIAHQQGSHTELIWAMSLQFGERESETRPTHNNRGGHLLVLRMGSSTDR